MSPGITNVDDFCDLLKQAVFHGEHTYEFDLVPTQIRNQRAILHVTPISSWSPLRVVWFEFFATGKKKWHPNFTESMKLHPRLQLLIVDATWDNPDHSPVVRSQLLEAVGLRVNS